MHWAAIVWLANNKMPDAKSLANFRLEQLRDEYMSYLREKGTDIFKTGLTIDECWGSAQLLYSKPATLFINFNYVNQIDNETPRIALNSQQLVWLAADLSCNSIHGPSGAGSIYDFPGLPILVSDGRRGHTIGVRGLSGIRYVHPRGEAVTEGWLCFTDSWPARSLLAPERNFAGVRALEDISRPPAWLMSPKDLAKVIVGFVLPNDAMPMFANQFNLLNEISALHNHETGPMYCWPGNESAEPFGVLLRQREVTTSRIAELGSTGYSRWTAMDELRKRKQRRQRP